MMRIFRTIEDVREHASQQARKARDAQDKYHRALARLNDGKTESQIGKELGFRPGGKAACREQIVSNGGAARAYEDMALALSEIAATQNDLALVEAFAEAAGKPSVCRNVIDAGKAAEGSFAEQRHPADCQYCVAGEHMNHQYEPVDPFAGFPTKVQER